MVNTHGETILLSASGTSAMEACIGSLLHPGDRVVVVDSGKFGHRWYELAKLFRLDIQYVNVPWGSVVSPLDIAKALTPETKALLMQGCETSTGVYHPIGEISQVMRQYPSCLFTVDGITVLGVHPIDMEGDGIDILIGSSQKAMMAPPGVSTVSLSQKAINQLHTSTSMVLSLDLELKAQLNDLTCFTPAIHIVFAMQAALDMIFDEGLKHVYQRHQRLSDLVRQSLLRAGLPLLVSDGQQAHGLTVVGPDLPWDVASWLAVCETQYGLLLAPGQNKLKDQVFRIGHMGYCTKQSVTAVLETLFLSLKGFYDLPTSIDSLIQD